MDDLINFFILFYYTIKKVVGEFKRRLQQVNHLHRKKKKKQNGEKVNRLNKISRKKKKKMFQGFFSLSLSLFHARLRPWESGIPNWNSKIYLFIYS